MNLTVQCLGLGQGWGADLPSQISAHLWWCEGSATDMISVAPLWKPARVRGVCLVKEINIRVQAGRSTCHPSIQRLAEQYISHYLCLKYSLPGVQITLNNLIHSWLMLVM